MDASEVAAFSGLAPAQREGVRTRGHDRLTGLAARAVRPARLNAEARGKRGPRRATRALRSGNGVAVVIFAQRSDGRNAVMATDDSRKRHDGERAGIHWLLIGVAVVTIAAAEVVSVIPPHSGGVALPSGLLFPD